MVEKNGFFGPQTVQHPGKPVVFRGVGFDLMKVNSDSVFERSGYLVRAGKTRQTKKA
jgi:hypothetical protein